MEVNNGRPTLPIGCKLYSYGAGMSETDAVVISEPDERNGSQRYVTISRYEDSQRFGVIEKYAKPISKKFGIGTYYDDSLAVTYTQAEIDEAVNAATMAQANREAAKKAYNEAYEAEKAAMPARYPHLAALVGGDWKARKADKKANLMAALRHAFAGIFFSVRNSHGSTYDIRWENGPTVREVDEVCNMFKNSKFNGMTDSTDYYDNAFADVFGSFEYLFTHRDPSREIIDIIEGNKHLAGDRSNPFYDAFARQSFPASAKITGFDDDANQYTYTTPDKVAVEEGTAGTLTIEHYSEKSFIVKGDTYAIKDTMKSLGGVWLRNVKAWCYSYKKLDTVKATLGIG